MAHTSTGSGSAPEFDREWRRVLEEGAERFRAYPSLSSGRQIDYFEWMKAERIEALLEKAGVSGGTVLEYGCGSAGMSLYLGSRGYEVHLCDLSSRALRVAGQNRDRHAPEVAIRSATAANAMRLPYPSDFFDIVMSYGVLEHFCGDALDRLLDDTVRVLKPGGLYVVDIVPGPKRFNARTLGLLVSALGSLGAKALTGKWRELGPALRAYSGTTYESTLHDRAWARLLAAHGLEGVTVDVCRPFPPLALAGTAERVYTRVLVRLQAVQQRFDGANNWFTRRWGWMYLAHGVKL